MSEVIKAGDGASSETNFGDFELGKWMGRREAFGAMAGRCSAAEIESLRQIREGKLYQHLNCTWDDFCARQLHVTSRTVDRDISYLLRFGPAFFTLRQLTRVSVREYAAIAGQITDDGIQVDGTVVPLLPHNSGELAAAIETLLRRQQPPALPAAPTGFEGALQKMRMAIQGLREFEGSLEREQMLMLARTMAEAISAASALGVSLVMD